MEERVYSSKLTYFYKVFFPGVWVSIFGVLVVSFWACGKLPESSGPQKVGLAVFWILASAYIFWYCLRLKKVRQVGDTLYVSDFSKEVSIPAMQVASATESRWDKNRLITIHLKSPCEFGDSIPFIPVMNWAMTPFKEHPVLTELRTALKLPAG